MKRKIRWRELQLHEERATRQWHEGTIGIPEGKQLKGKATICHYYVKAYDEGSEYGIEDGKISKMTIEINGQKVCNYDRGWDVYPETEEANIAYAILMELYN
jgi:hypothetical protein